MRYLVVKDPDGNDTGLLQEDFGEFRIVDPLNVDDNGNPKPASKAQLKKMGGGNAELQLDEQATEDRAQRDAQLQGEG